MARLRGFEPVEDKFRVHKYTSPNTSALKVFQVQDGESTYVYYIGDITLPNQADARSAGYDFYAMSDVQLLPMQKQIIWTDVKAYMQEDEVLEIYIRSSLAIKSGIMLSNNVGIIDSSYYNNAGNDGNIGIALVNTTGTSITIKARDRFAQGIFKKFLLADNAIVNDTERTGGFGSSGK